VGRSSIGQLMPKHRCREPASSYWLRFERAVTAGLNCRGTVNFTGGRSADRNSTGEKRISTRRNSFGQDATNSLCVDGLALLESVQLQP